MDPKIRGKEKGMLARRRGKRDHPMQAMCLRPRLVGKNSVIEDRCAQQRFAIVLGGPAEYHCSRAKVFG